MGQFSKNTEFGGNPKALNKTGCTSKGNKRIRSLGERPAGVREESWEGPVSELEGEYRERGQGGAGLWVDSFCPTQVSYLFLMN